MAHNKEYEAILPYLRENQDHFYRLAYSYVKNSETALDLVQDAIVKALQKIKSLKHPEYMKTWFYRILVNECLMYLRRAKPVLFLDDLEYALPAPTLNVDQAEAWDLYNAIDKLDNDLKTIVFLRFYEEMKLEEIAKVTNTNVNTVKSRLYKALKQLRNEISGNG